jgi:exopolysaccharide biosynthesis polyprenyl glycosylphosphotransferase
MQMSETRTPRGGHAEEISSGDGLGDGPVQSFPLADGDLATAHEAIVRELTLPEVVGPESADGDERPDYIPPSMRRDTVRRRSLALADMVALALSYGLVWLVIPPDASLRSKLVLAAALPLWVLLNKLLGLYDRDPHVIHKSTLDELPRLVHSVLLGSMLIFLLAPLIPGLEIGRPQTIAFALSAMVLVPALRGTARWALDRRLPEERCVIVGSGRVADMVARKLGRNPEHGVELIGFMDEAWGEAEEGSELPRLGDVSEFQRVCRDHDVDRVIIAFSSLSHDELLAVMRTSKQLNIKLNVVPRLFEAIGQGVEIDQVEGMTLLALRGFSRTRSSLLLKRSLDIVGAGAGLLVLAPFLIGMAIAIKLTSRGSIFYTQRRIGRTNRPFRMYKFRTMYRGADRLKPSLLHLNEATGPMFKMSEDPRVTPVGRFLRRFSLDELPQLWNVLRGEMSLVGPRPLIPDEDEHVMGPHRTRLDLTPGLTGPWQVMGRTQIPFAEMVKLDYMYVAEWSLWNDLRLLLRTAPVVLQGRGR